MGSTPRSPGERRRRCENVSTHRILRSGFTAVSILAVVVSARWIAARRTPEESIEPRIPIGPESFATNLRSAFQRAVVEREHGANEPSEGRRGSARTLAVESERAAL